MQDKCEKCSKPLCPRISKLGNHMTDEKGMDEECHGICNPKTVEDIRLVHDYFELTYANYLSIPRCILQSMPDRWQVKFVRLLDELDEAFDWRRSGILVRLVDNEGWRIERDEFNDYDRGHRVVTQEEAKAITERHNKLYKDGVPESSRTKEDILAFNNGAEYGSTNMLETVLDIADQEIAVHGKVEAEGLSEDYKAGFIKGLEQMRNLVQEIDVAETLNP